MKVYLLYHKHEVEPDVADVKNIGLYSSVNIANATIEIYKDIQGFKDYPDGFCIKEFDVLDQTEELAVSGQVLYLLEHEYTVKEADIYYDYVTEIGVFASRINAETMMEDLKKSNDYVNKRNGIYEDNAGFCISNYVLDENNWQEGFVTWELV